MEKIKETKLNWQLVDRSTEKRRGDDFDRYYDFLDALESNTAIRYVTSADCDFGNTSITKLGELIVAEGILLDTQRGRGYLYIDLVKWHGIKVFVDQSTEVFIHIASQDQERFEAKVQKESKWREIKLQSGALYATKRILLPKERAIHTKISFENLGHLKSGRAYLEVILCHNNKLYVQGGFKHTDKRLAEIEEQKKDYSNLRDIELLFGGKLIMPLEDLLELISYAKKTLNI